MNLPTSQTDNVWFWVILGSHTYPGLPIGGIPSSRALSNWFLRTVCQHQPISHWTSVTWSLPCWIFRNCPRMPETGAVGRWLVVNQPEIGSWKFNTDNKGRGHWRIYFNRCVAVAWLWLQFPTLEPGHRRPHALWASNSGQKVESKNSIAAKCVFFSGVWESRFCDEIIKSPEKIMASRGGMDVFWCLTSSDQLINFPSILNLPGGPSSRRWRSLA